MKKKLNVWQIILVVIVGLGIIGAIIGGDDKEEVAEKTTEKVTEKVAEKETEKETEKGFYDVGETADSKGLEITLTELTESEGTDYNKPTDGNIFILVKFKITNNTDKEVNISSILHFDAYIDDSATSDSLSALVDADGQSLNGTIAANKNLEGYLGYEAPSDWQVFEIYFKSGSRNEIIFKHTK